MKKYFIFLASAALMIAACNKVEDIAPVEPAVETELITVELNPMTKTSLGESGATTWLEGDKVSVTVDGTHIGDLTLVAGTTGTFSGEVEAGKTGEALLHYPSGITAVPAEQEALEGSFANGAALLDGTATMDALRAGEAVTLSNSTALLQFISPLDADVTFIINETTYTVTGCEAGKIYYACVDPENNGKLSYTVGIVSGAKEKADFAPVAGKVYPLGDEALPLKESQYGVIGVNGKWGGSDDIMMYETTKDNLYVSFGVTFSSAGNFKVRKAGGWNDSYNYGTISTATKSADSVVGVYTDGGSGNINVAAGTYDIYFDRLASQVYIMEQGKSYAEASQPAKPTTTYSLIGSFTGSNWNTDFNMNYAGDGIWTINKELAASVEWKIRQTGTWNSSWGYSNLYPGNDLATSAGGNIKLSGAGDYLIGFIKDKNKITLVKK